MSTQSKSKSKTIYVDLDGTMAEYHGWQGHDRIGQPIEGARLGCNLLSKHFRLVCFTARTNLDIVERWLKGHGFPHMSVTNVKGGASVFLDDRAINFSKWDDELVKRLKEFKPHWEQKGAD